MKRDTLFLMKARLEKAQALGNLGRKYTLEEAENILKIALQKKSKFISI